MDRETFLNLIPAYALGALDDDERVEFEAQLAEDSEAQNLLSEYQALTGALVLAVPARQAPEHLGEAMRRRLNAPKSAAPVAPNKVLKPIWARWLAAAAALALILGTIWGLTRPQTGNLPEGQQLYNELSAMSGSLHLYVNAGEEFTNVTGDLVASPGSTSAVIQVANLPSITEDQTFQLWLAGPEGVISGGLFRAMSPDAPTFIVLPLELPFEQYQGFGVSLEPAGGSPYPDQRSGPRVFNVRLGDA